MMKSLPHKTEDLGLIPRMYTKLPGVIVFACNLVAGEAGKRGSLGLRDQKTHWYQHTHEQKHMHKHTCIHVRAHTVSGTLKVNVSVKELDKA